LRSAADTLSALNTPAVPGPPWIGSRSLPRTSFCTVAERRVERDLQPVELADRVEQRLADPRVLGAQAARRVRRVVRVEGRVERGAALLREQALRVAAEQQRAARVEVVAHVPGAQDRARPLGARRLLAHGDGLVAPQLAGVLAVVEDRVHHGLLRVLDAVDHEQPDARAQRAGGALVADDPREALQALLEVAQPVRVVGVHRVVAAEHGGQVLGRPERPGLDRARVAAPAARAARAVEHGQAQRLERRAAERGVALLALSSVTCGTTLMSA
jgi:hypothetical protein